MDKDGDGDGKLRGLGMGEADIPLRDELLDPFWGWMNLLVVLAHDSRHLSSFNGACSFRQFGRWNIKSIAPSIRHRVAVSF